MIFIGGLLLAFAISPISAVSITASDLPECAVECYCDTGRKVNIPITDYEGQCRSAPFQIALRECAEKACNEEEYAFVIAPDHGTDDRLNTKLRNIVPNLEWI
jgi:CFEM domain